MQKILLLILLLLSFKSYSQCVDCQSLNDALIKPEMVKTIKMNGLMSDVVLDSLPKSIGLLLNVQVLFLSDHNFKTIPHEIGNLQKLTSLSFAGCKLEKLPGEIFLLKNLQEIILVNNAFSEAYIKTIKEKFAELLPNVKVRL